MALELTGKILQIMPETGGVSKAGKEWKKQEFLIETIETYPKKVFLSMMGDKTNEIKRFPVVVNNKQDFCIAVYLPYVGKLVETNKDEA